MPVRTHARPDDPLRVQRATLPNGLTVLVSPNHEQPRVFARVVVRAGAAQEPRETTGLAHYLEHMLANKGTRSLGTLDHASEEVGLRRITDLYESLGEQDDEEARGRIFREIAEQSAAIAAFAVPNELKQVHGRLGSRGLNAFTSHDQTSYVVDVPAGRLGAWARLDGDRFLDPVFRSFQTEVETICEEKKRSLDEPGKQTHRALMAALWAGHPYAEPVLGRSEHLERPSIRAMQAFFSRWYRPGNMAVVLAGDVDPGEAIRLVHEHFGALTPGPALVRAGAPAPLPPGEQRVSIQHRAQPELRIGWRTVPAGHPDELAIALLDEVLSNDGTGLLDRLGQEQLVRSAGSFQSARLQGGSFCVWGRPRAGQDLHELEALVLAQVERVAEGDFSERVLRGIVRNVEVDELAAREQNKGRASRIAEAWLRGADPQDTERQLRELRRVSAADVQRVARQYLGPDRVVLHRTEGPPDLRAPVTPDLPPLPPSGRGHSGLFREVVAAPAATPSIAPLVLGEDFSVWAQGGLRVVQASNPHNDLVRMSLRWTEGWQARRGLDTAGRLALHGGVPGQGRAELEQALFELATTMDLRVGRWTTDLALAGPRETAAEALSLALRRLREPVIGAEESHKEIDDLLLRRRQARSNRDHAVRALSAFASRGKDSVYLQRLPEPELRALADRGPAASLAGMEAGAVLAMVTGPITAAALEELLGAARVSVTPPPVLEYVRLTRDRIHLLHHPGQQAQITIHVPLGGYDPTDYAPRRLWAETLGGPAGLVFQEVREKRGMAYSAHAGVSTGWRAGDHNLAWMQAGTEASKAVQATALLLELLRGFPATEARLARVRASTLARRRSDRIGFRSIPGTVEDWRGKGIDADPIAQHLAALSECSDEAVRAYGRDVANRAVTVSIVGDLGLIDRDALAGIAEVTELTIEQLDRL